MLDVFIGWKALKTSAHTRCFLTHVQQDLNGSGTAITMAGILGLHKLTHIMGLVVSLSRYLTGKHCAGVYMTAVLEK